jgi:DNA repair protein RecN (Recombination protein N)
VLVVTHSPQVAARARITGGSPRPRPITTPGPRSRRSPRPTASEIALMLSGDRITDAARAAARALLAG